MSENKNEGNRRENRKIKRELRIILSGSVKFHRFARFKEKTTCMQNKNEKSGTVRGCTVRVTDLTMRSRARPIPRECERILIITSRTQ